MASGRFVKFTEANINSFSAEQENVNTKKKTSYDVKLFKEFNQSINQSINQSLFKHGKSSVKLKKSFKKCLNTVLHDCRVGIRYVRDSNCDLSFEKFPAR